MFERLSALPPDPVLSLMAMFRADEFPGKVDLGVGVYLDEAGVASVLRSVREAERLLVEEQKTKAYLGPSGNEHFNTLVTQLLLGSDHPALVDGRVYTIQTPGGCSALRLGGELLTRVRRGTCVYLSDPTWANHEPLMSAAGLQCKRYPYFDLASGTAKFGEMLASISVLSPGEVVLLQASCHNPTGADLTPAHWEQLAHLLASTGVIPFIDVAYPGLGRGLDADLSGARLVTSAVPEALVAFTGSKTFGLYRERVGALLVISERAKDLEAAGTHLRAIARESYSMPPDHGAAVVARILSTAGLNAQWLSELERMRARINELRHAFSATLREVCLSQEFAGITRQTGMFSILDLPAAVIERLRGDYHIYMAGTGRINITGLRKHNLEYVAQAITSSLSVAMQGEP